MINRILAGILLCTAGAAAQCTYQIKPIATGIEPTLNTAYLYNKSGVVQQLDLNITAPAGCAWNQNVRTADQGWITLGQATPASATGTGTLHVSVASNTGTTRQGIIYFGTTPQTPFTIQQSSSTCVYSQQSNIPSPIPANGGTYDVTVTTGTACFWNVWSESTAVSVAAPSGGQGPPAAAVKVTVAANHTATTRNMTLHVGTLSVALTQSAGTGTAVLSDMNRDGVPDLIWQNDITRQVGVWYMAGAQATTQIGYSYPAPDSYPGWTLVTVADLDGNGTPDLVWQNDDTRTVGTWYMGGTNGTTVIGVAYQAPGIYPGWRLASVHDMNGDGVPDLVWQNDTTRQVGTWFMSGPQATNVIGVAYQAPGSYPGWTLVGVADMDNNGVPDLIWQNDTTRSVGTWYMSGAQATVQIGVAYQTVDSYPGWRVVAVQDMDGNGVPDLVWQNENTRVVGTWYMSGPQATTVLGVAYQTTTTYPNWRALGAK